jgi:hypothetical protein
LERLAGVSLVTFGMDGSSVSAHRVFFAHYRKLRAREGILAAAGAAAARLLRTALRPGHPDSLTSREQSRGRLLGGGQPGEAMPLYERTLADGERGVRGPDHPCTRTLRENLAPAKRSAK